MKMKKRKGNVVDILPSIVLILAAILLVGTFINLYGILTINEEVKQLSRKYMLTMETMGYLDPASRTKLEQELSALNVTDIDLSGSTLTDAGYGNTITLNISCHLPLEHLNMAGSDMLAYFFEDSSIPVSSRRMSTAKN